MKRDYVKVEATHLTIPRKGMELVQLEAKLTIMDSGEVRVTGKPFSEVLKCENEYKEMIRVFCQEKRLTTKQVKYNTKTKKIVVIEKIRNSDLLHEGDSLVLNATVKEHSVYNDQKQTIIQRPKLVF